MMKNYLKTLTIALLFSSSAVYGQLDPPCLIAGATLCDNFDAYTTGDPLGPGASWWSTWSGVEGTSEDGTISSDYAYSGTNSALIPEGGVADVILKLGDLSSGVYRLQWQMYIPDGKMAYYNIQESEVPGVAWNMEVYFGQTVSGEGEFTVPVGPDFLYPVDEWFLVEHVIDMDANTILVFMNGLLVLDDAFAGNMGSIDFYSASATNRLYIDDVLLEEIVPAVACAIPGAIFCDNIDTYTAGDAVGPYAEWWSTWSGVEGGAEDGIVSDDYAYSGDNSVLIPETGSTDAILKLGDLTSGTLRLEWQMYIPSGKSAYYNIQETEVPGVMWNLELYFGNVTEGTGSFTVPAAGPSFTYPVAEWFLIEHIVNLDDNTIKVYIDGVLVLNDAYTGNLGGVDFFSASGTNRYYLDDVLFIEAAAAGPCAIPGAVFCDNIDTYPVGALGPNAEWWSTWSGAEGGAEDGLVSTDYAASGDNSVLIPEGGVTDVILKLGDLSDGKYSLSWNMYVPSGKHGYYNIQETEVPGVAWNAELYFGLATPGEGEVTVPVEVAFSYPADAWFTVEHIIDMDANTIDIIIDGTTVVSEVYGGNLGGVDFYSIDANNRYYIDDVLLMPMAPVDLNTYYADADSDTYGNADVSITVEGGAPAGYVENNLDCDDTDPAIYPGATEVLNGKDDDCDELIDEGLVGIADLNANGVAVAIYPVPVNSNVTIEIRSLLSGNNASLEIFNTIGQVVYAEQLVLSTTTLVKQINFESMSSGLYMVKLTSGETVVNGQIVVQH